MIERLSPGAIVERLDRALDAFEGGVERAALATDGDGTLWTHDVGEALFHLVLEERRIGAAAIEALLHEADAHSIAIADRHDGVAIARALWDAYVAGRYPEDRMCAAITWCTAGSTIEEVAEIATRMLATSFDLPRKLIGESATILRWAERRGVPTWLVSASPRVVVEAAADVVVQKYGTPRPRVLAMTPRLEGGVIRPELVGAWTYGEGKVEALSEALAIEGRNLVAAMGDNVFDGPMLRAACVPIAIRPKKALVDIAGSVPGLLEPEWKE